MGNSDLMGYINHIVYKDKAGWMVYENRMRNISQTGNPDQIS